MSTEELQPMSEREKNLVTKIEYECRMPEGQRNETLIALWKAELDNISHVSAGKKIIICFHSSFYVINAYIVVAMKKH